MAKFAKLFENERGQILVKLDSNADTAKPEVRFYVNPEDLGICSLAMSFEDSDNGWDMAEKAFEKIDFDSAVIMQNAIFENIEKLSGEQE